jgi:hypothetical protein
LSEVCLLTKENKAIMGVSMSKSLKETIDTRRGDIPRSGYISRILGRQLLHQKQNGNGTENQQNRSRAKLGQNSANSLSFPATASEVGVVDGQV